MQIKTSAKPYFDSVSRPFVSGNPGALLQKAQEAGLSEEVTAHRGWIAVTYMTPPLSSEDPYYYVAKILGAFALADVLAIIHPARGLVIKWQYEMVKPLEAGEYKAIFAGA